MSLFDIALVLFLIMDPIGTINPYLSLVNEIDYKRQKWVVFREMVVALVFMVAFNYLGEYLLKFLELSDTSLLISSGLILFLIAVKILFTSADNPRANLPKGEPFIFPLAVPLIAGPGLLATIMLYARLEPSQLVMLMSIFIAWALSVIILLSANKIKRVIKTNGLIACEKLIGMVLVLISVQRFLEGIMLFWKNYHS